MDLGLEGKVALVGGASKGLGFAVAMALAAEGARVVLCARDAAVLGEAAGRVREATGAEVLGVPADLCDPAAQEGLVDRARETFGAVQILVNNAGGPPPGTIAELGPEQWNRAVDLLLHPVVRAVRLLLPGMRAAGWGRILNLTSIAVKQPVPGLALSNSLRAAVVGFARTLAAEVAAEGITVNNLAPGYFGTERLEALMEREAQRSAVTREEVRRRFTEEVPAGRLGRPEELGALAAFLCSERAAYINGVTLAIDGGLCRALL